MAMPRTRKLSCPWIVLITAAIIGHFMKRAMSRNAMPCHRKSERLQAPQNAKYTNSTTGVITCGRASATAPIPVDAIHHVRAIRMRAEATSSLASSLKRRSTDMRIRLTVVMAKSTCRPAISHRTAGRPGRAAATKWL